jgi:hypothetical protein
MFGPKREEATETWRKLHNEELHNLHVLGNIIEVIKSSWIRWARHIACIREMNVAYRTLIGRLERRRPLGRPERIWKDNINKFI